MLAGAFVDSRAYRRPTRITRRHLFRVGQRAARSLPERRSAKFRRASRFLLVQGRQRAQTYCVSFGVSALGLGGSLLLSRLASASCFFVKASYSGVPGLGGMSFGAPPNHVGA